MYDYTTISGDIEAEYDAFCLDKSRNLDALYRMLFVYLKVKIAKWIMEGSYVNEDAVEDLTQDTLVAIMDDGIYRFEKREASFVTYCCVIAKNKAMDYVRRRNRHRMVDGEPMESISNRYDSSRIFANPEKLMVEYEYRLELMEELKRYLKIMINWPQKPYRTVASCYTLILFHKYHPRTRELGSPRWAFEEVKEETVGASAERFICELNQWIRHITLDWSDDFRDEMDESENGVLIGDIIFGEWFKVKDFENWSIRLREKVKRQLQELAEKEDRVAFELD